jgi:hypothetical protein
VTVVQLASRTTSKACSAGSTVLTQLLADELLLNRQQDRFGLGQGQADITYSGIDGVAMQSQGFYAARRLTSVRMELQDECATHAASSAETIGRPAYRASAGLPTLFNGFLLTYISGRWHYSIGRFARP